MTNQTTNSNEPVSRIKDGLLQIAIWKNETEKGRPCRASKIPKESARQIIQRVARLA